MQPIAILCIIIILAIILLFIKIHADPHKHFKNAKKEIQKLILDAEHNKWHDEPQKGIMQASFFKGRVLLLHQKGLITDEELEELNQAANYMKQYIKTTDHTEKYIYKR
ncbi:hypothetical protein [Intestinibacillus massiliensis]|uniref:hypothetical protein n=1 Tax=Intestinibacillus massiliensis TaxID=1871029 RepID=UPI000B35E6B8|nr:hypothetical protein [Intestinibacillus massiliensis]